MVKSAAANVTPSPLTPPTEATEFLKEKPDIALLDRWIQREKARQNPGGALLARSAFAGDPGGVDAHAAWIEGHKVSAISWREAAQFSLQSEKPGPSFETGR